MANSDKKSNILGTVIFIVLLAAVVVGIYLSVTRSKREAGKLEANVEISEVKTLTGRNLKVDYPGTAREVMKFYCRLTQCLYSEDLSDKEIEQLIDQVRGLYSDDLLENNDRDEMIALARGEIKHYRSNKKVINSYNVAESADIVYYRNTTPNRAVINIYFTVKDGTGEYTRAYEEFVLIEDTDGRWKIMGWRSAED